MAAQTAVGTAVPLLPPELQAMIWEFAVSSDRAGMLPVPESFFAEMINEQKFDPLKIKHIYAAFCRVTSWYDTDPLCPEVNAVVYGARKTMMRVSRFTRGLALKAWRDDIAAVARHAYVNLMGWEGPDLRRGMDLYSMREKRDLVRRLERLISEGNLGQEN